VKPLVFDRINIDDQRKLEEVDGSNSNVNLDNNSNDFRENTDERELSEIEKEAWKLLRGAAVTYYPVGTVANDPANKQPLNYDRVLICDIVPSALAFLLNGVKGKLSRIFYFTAHTLQLRVSYGFYNSINLSLLAVLQNSLC
jgi:hypothetical protein